MSLRAYFKKGIALSMLGALAVSAQTSTDLSTIILKNSSGQPLNGVVLDVKCNTLRTLWTSNPQGPGWWKQVEGTSTFQVVTDKDGKATIMTEETFPFGRNVNDIMAISPKSKGYAAIPAINVCDGDPQTNDAPDVINVVSSDLNPTTAKVTTAGLRASLYGATSHYNHLAYEDEHAAGYTAPFPTKSEWTAGAKKFNSAFSTGNNPVLIWIVGEADWDEDIDGYSGSTSLKMKKPSGSFDSKINFTNGGESWAKDGWYLKDPNQRTKETDWTGFLNDDYLNYFDANGIDIFLQIEPANANIVDQIKIVMDRFASHKCVIGFGIDLEFYDIGADGVNRSYPSKSEVESWYKKVKEYETGGREYELFLKHFKIAACEGGGYRGAENDIIYVDDVQDMGDLYNFLYAEHSADDGMVQWANHFGDNPVWFQIGYAADWYHTNTDGIYDPDPSTKPWFEKVWGSNRDNIRDGLTEALLREVDKNQTIGMIWVDFTMRKLLSEFVTPAFNPSPAPVYMPTAAYEEGAIVAYGGSNWEAQWWTQGETPGEKPVWEGISNVEVLAWNEATAYEAGDVVLYAGTAWQAQWWNQNRAPGSGGGDWRNLITTPTPAWNNEQVYVKGDEVELNDVIFRAKWWNKGEVPGEADVWVVVE